MSVCLKQYSMFTVITKVKLSSQSSSRFLGSAPSLLTCMENVQTCFMKICQKAIKKYSKCSKLNLIYWSQAHINDACCIEAALLKLGNGSPATRMLCTGLGNIKNIIHVIIHLGIYIFIKMKTGVDLFMFSILFMQY